MKPKITVIVPAYNAEKTIEKTLASLKNQSFKDFDVIIVDDSSTDNTINVAKRFFKKVIKNKGRKGPAGARNTGIKEAKTEKLAFIDSDCFADKDWIKNIYKELEKEDAVMGNVKIPKSNYIGNSISLLGFPGGGNLGFEKVWKVKNGYTDHITSCNFGIKKSIFKKYGFFDDTFPYAGSEDPEFSIKIFKQGVKIKYAEKPLVYHLPRDSLSSFIKWQITRGKGNFHFKRKVGKVGDLIRLRMWYAMNVVFYNFFRKEIFLIVTLLFLSFMLQQYGYIIEKTNYENKLKY